MKLKEKKQEVSEAWKKRCAEAPWLGFGTIFLSVHGSTAYGLDTETSDADLTGICIPPERFHFGFLHKLDQFQFNKPDGQIYGIKKFFQLATDANPNVLELLFIDPEFWVMEPDDSYLELIKNRELFLSAKVRWTYAGYASAQLNRIKLHKKHLLNPPTHQPTREEFDLPPKRLISRDQQGALNALQKEEDYKIDLNENFILYLDKENKYNRAKQEWEQYNNWKDTRNPARAELEAKFGYDTKHASHLVRLLRQGREILTNGTLQVLRKD